VSPRNTAAGALETRRSILGEAVRVASLEGLEGLSIGRLADELGMSKAGVVGPFGSKEALQLATFEAAIDDVRQAIWEPVAGVEPGLPRLRALCRTWIGYLTGTVRPGGCFMTGSAAEFDGRPGVVRDAVAAVLRGWLGMLAAEARVAVKAGELDPARDPADVAFELNAIAAGLNQAVQLLGEPAAAERAGRAMARVLGLDPGEAL
jgi:AcrR family transcriptional regulator